MFRIDILLSLWSSISISYNLEVQAANVFGLFFSNISCTRLIKDPVSIRDRVVYNSLPLSFWIYERKYGVTRCPDRAGLREATSQRTRISTTSMFDFMKPLLLYYHPFNVALTNTIFCLFNTRMLSIFAHGFLELLCLFVGNASMLMPYRGIRDSENTPSIYTHTMPQHIM